MDQSGNIFPATGRFDSSLINREQFDPLDQIDIRCMQARDGLNIKFDSNLSHPQI
jgi:hypothetical protein